MDYAALFAATPSPYLVLGPDLVIVEVNQAYLEATGRTRKNLLGQFVFDAFPDNPADPTADGVRNLNASLHRVLASRRSDTMALQKYDIPLMNRPGEFEERWWSPTNTPILTSDGTVAWIIHRVEDVTAFVEANASENQPSSRQLTERESPEAELYARSRELQRLNEELRQAHTRERHVAVALQEAATRSLNVCGDWYDMVDLSDGHFAVAVGDVVGHGLEAAAAMGMLRSALSAAIRALERPAQALEVLGLYSRSVEGALNTTVVQVLVDPTSRLIIYSSAGHPPPALVHADGTFELLDQATDPPLGARLQHVPRPQATINYGPGDTLLLYTDGLIERRGEDIDTSLARLTGLLIQYRHLTPEDLADTLLAHLGLVGGGRDDTALIIVRL